MSVALQRAQLKTILQAVTGIGTVKDCAGVLQEEADLKAAFGATILGCQYDRQSTDEEPAVSSQNEARHAWLLQLAMEVDEDGGSPKTFQVLVDAVCAALRTHPTLNGTADRTSGPPQVRTVEYRDFDGYTVHYAEITFLAIEAIDYVAV